MHESILFRLHDTTNLGLWANLSNKLPMRQNNV